MSELQSNLDNSRQSELSNERPERRREGPAKPARRSRNRSRSGAQSECPHCGKKLRGKKGLEAHVEEMHQ